MYKYVKCIYVKMALTTRDNGLKGPWSRIFYCFKPCKRTCLSTHCQLHPFSWQLRAIIYKFYVSVWMRISIFMWCQLMYRSNFSTDWSPKYCKILKEWKDNKCQRWKRWRIESNYDVSDNSQTVKEITWCMRQTIRWKGINRQVL